MLILNAADVRKALPMPQAVQGMKEAFAALSDGRAVVPPRAHLPIARNHGISLIMPAYVDDADLAAQSLTVKVVSLFDGNPARGLARIQAAVIVLEPDTGRPLALLEGATLTAIRTAAASGAATDLLARPESRSLAVFGAGVQARAHIEAICAVRPIERVLIHSRTPANVQKLISELQAHDQQRRDEGAHPPTVRAATAKPSSTEGEKRPPVKEPLLFIAASSACEAIQGADIICTTTTSKVPVFDDADLPSGVHINAVGSYTPQAREVPAETVCRAIVVVDSRFAAWEEAGDLIQPHEAGLIDRGHIRAELGELVLGRKVGRTSAHEITFFKSVGVAVQDAVAARVALENARRRGLGRAIDW